jgi:hypothetical protein
LVKLLLHLLHAVCLKLPADGQHADSRARFM